ncbi:MAG: osmosensitive channel signal transduction histidine kinase [Chlorobi bacterium]|nr:osmosensitive channel signal transduction histidine kinase [Chlorobiota bacterium]
MPDGNALNDRRPQPDALLAAVERDDRTRGGRLKIFLGAAPGVGKTYTMLEAARIRRRQGTAVTIGIVETHGRMETAALVEGLNIIPRRNVEYKGRVIEEMDIDAILALRPELVLVDELAHTNAPGSRHLKRYLDVEELLAAGIDVYTTLNIQHLESLNDAVAQITGIRVRETVPDRIVERADEVEMVDISVEDLLQRLRDGKVYIPDQAERAVRSYFRPGNLSALRQLALRHTAARVDDQMRDYMRAHAISGPWPTQERLMVSIGPSPLSQRLVRATRRMAERRRAEWMAVYVETPGHYRLSDAARDRVSRTLRLAEELGGEAATIPGEHVPEDLVRYAQTRNVTEIVIGKSHRSRWFELLHGSIVKDLIRRSGNIDIYVITGEEEDGDQPSIASNTRTPQRLNDYLLSLLAVVTAAVIAHVLKSFLSLPNLSMVFLSAVLMSAVLWGLRVSIFASILSVLVYDFFLVPPIHTFSIASPQDVLALIIFLAVAILTSNLTGRIREQANAARKREERTAALYGLSRVIAGTVRLEDALRAIVDQIAGNLRAKVVVLLPVGEVLEQKGAHPEGIALDERERGAATWSWKHDQPAGRGTDTLPGDQWFYLPLRSAGAAAGVLAIALDDTESVIPPDQRRLLEALADQAAVAIERARLAHDFEQARLMSERDRFQAILLSSISHDLRTPLASILGAATTLQRNDADYDDATRRDLLTMIQEETERLNRFVGNLLDTTRLESGELRLNREWMEVNDLIGSAVGRLERPLGNHKLTLEVEAGLPLIRLDFVLLEQVFVNLLDNAVRYSATGTGIQVRAYRNGESIVIDVTDEGRGVPPEDLERIFDKFYRVRHGDRQTAGTGLGLTICKGIVEEHGGTIRALLPGISGAGTTFRVELPIEQGAPLMTNQDDII